MGGAPLQRCTEGLLEDPASAAEVIDSLLRRYFLFWQAGPTGIAYPETAFRYNPLANQVLAGFDSSQAIVLSW